MFGREFKVENLDPIEGIRIAPNSTKENKSYASIFKNEHLADIIKAHEGILMNKNGKEFVRFDKRHRLAHKSDKFANPVPQRHTTI